MNREARNLLLICLGILALGLVGLYAMSTNLADPNVLDTDGSYIPNVPKIMEDLRRIVGPFLPTF